MNNSNEIVFTTKYIFKDKKDITQVIHDAEGDWQFLSNDEITESDALLVSFDQIIDYDNSIRTLLHLPKNKIAYRTNKYDNWIIEDL